MSKASDFMYELSKQLWKMADALANAEQQDKDGAATVDSAVTARFKTDTERAKEDPNAPPYPQDGREYTWLSRVSAIVIGAHVPEGQSGIWLPVAKPGEGGFSPGGAPSPEETPL